MKYSSGEIKQYIREEDVKFIRLAFCDVYGRQKNISVMPGEIDRAFDVGIAIDTSAIDGFGGVAGTDLMLHPDPSTLAVLPWRPEHGRVVRMFCSITYPDGRPYENDTRSLLRTAAERAGQAGIDFAFGSQMEFYLFKTDDNGNSTGEPHDNAGYLDIAPADKGENVRREICLTLEQMGILPESSHHEEGPGQNEIDFRYSDCLSAADNAVTFRAVVQTIAARNGLFADFSPKPILGKPGNGFHINFSAKSANGADVLPAVVAGILDKAADMTLFLNHTEGSYRRLNSSRAPSCISWSDTDNAQLIRVHSAAGQNKRGELRSPDPLANPYLAFALIIHAGLHGINNGMTLSPPAVDSGNPRLPRGLDEAKAIAVASDFISETLPKSLTDAYCGRK